jgi:hypothetical protein
MRQPNGCFDPVWKRGCGGPEHVHAAACKNDGGLTLAFSLTALATAEGTAVLVAEQAEGGLVEDSLEIFSCHRRPRARSGHDELSEYAGHASG